LTDEAPAREVDPIEREPVVGSTLAEPDAQRRQDVAAVLTTAVFGSTDEALIDNQAENRRTSEPPTLA